MGFELDIFQDASLEADYIEWLVDTQSVDIQTHFGRLWDYYTNPRIETAGSGAHDRKVAALRSEQTSKTLLPTGQLFSV